MEFNLRSKSQFLRRLSMEPDFGSKVKAIKRREKKRETDTDTHAH